MAECVNKLPEPIHYVVIPEFFSVSQVIRFDQCRLNALADSHFSGSDKLRKHPSAELGEIYHALMAKAVRYSSTGVIVSVHELSQWFDALLEVVRVRLEQNPCTSSYADLRKTFLPVVWERKRRQILDATVAIISSRVYGNRARTGAIYEKFNFTALRGDGRWSEVPIHVPEFRLSGRLDLVERRGRQITITDLKTGNACDATGAVRPEIVKQLQLYGAMVQILEPTSEIRLGVNDGTEHPIVFDGAVFSELRSWIDTDVKVLSPGDAVPAKTVSTVGPSCRWCRLRHRCQEYLQDSPNRWRITVDWRLPSDIWGIVERLTSVGNGLYDLTMVDAAGRRVKVFRVHERYLAENIVGTPLWMYELATSSTPQNGVGSWRHPLNFHEFGTSDTTDRAWVLQVFA